MIRRVACQSATLPHTLHPPLLLTHTFTNQEDNLVEEAQSSAAPQNTQPDAVEKFLRMPQVSVDQELSPPLLQKAFGGKG